MKGEKQMNKKKIEPKEARYLATIIALIGIIIWLVTCVAQLYNANVKYETIMDVACESSYNSGACKAGVTTLKAMSLEDIKKLKATR